jgi:hypothetical protein
MVILISFDYSCLTNNWLQLQPEPTKQDRFSRQHSLKALSAISDCLELKSSFFTTQHDASPWWTTGQRTYPNNSNFQPEIASYISEHTLSSSRCANPWYWCICRDISAIFKFNLGHIFLSKILRSISSKNFAYQAWCCRQKAQNYYFICCIDENMLTWNNYWKQNLLRYILQVSLDIFWWKPLFAGTQRWFECMKRRVLALKNLDFWDEIHQPLLSQFFLQKSFHWKIGSQR